MEDESEIQLIDRLLEEQQNLTAVERFAERHEAVDLPLRARTCHELIPTERPGEGQQYAFRVDLDGCTGCKACVTACHSLNGLEAGETWRDVGRLIGEDADLAYQQTVTTSCHHCEKPACLAGCPVQAYEKDPETGIVRHLDDQCIGCQYCVLQCPYDAPKYNPALGIVRKCDMCMDRLAVGEAPACVQGCSNRAISITIVDTGFTRNDSLLPVAEDAMPGSGITRPTTRYVGIRPRPERIRPADASARPREEAHTSLVLMTIAVQFSVGMLWVDVFSGVLAPRAWAALGSIWALVAAAVGILGQAGALLHLGRPLYAFRTFLGWRTSWMSREVLVLVNFAGLLAAYGASHWAGASFIWADMPPGWLPIVQKGLGIGALATGLLATFCSAMIYADTQRPFWSLGRSSFRFFGSALVLGISGSLLCATLAALTGAALPDLLVTTLSKLNLVAIAGKSLVEFSFLRHRGRDALGRSAQLMRGALGVETTLRFAAAALAGLCLLVLLAGANAAVDATAGLALASFTFLLVGELLERHLFFRAEAARAMPGLG